MFRCAACGCPHWRCECPLLDEPDPYIERLLARRRKEKTL